MCIRCKSDRTADCPMVYPELEKCFWNLVSISKIQYFFSIAQEAFTYESYYFDTYIQNWPYFILPNRLESYIKAYTDKTLRLQTRDINRLCNGAVGIGITRLRAFELLKKNEYKKDINRAITKTINTFITPINKTYKTAILSVCCRSSGAVELFLQSYTQFKNKKHLTYAEKIATYMIKQKEKRGQYVPGLIAHNFSDNVSFLKGNSGIGFTLLRIASYGEINPIIPLKITRKISQKVDRNLYPFITQTFVQLHTILLQGMFPRTITYC